MTAPTVEQQVDEVDQPERTGGMVALVPTEEDAAKLTVEGGDSADELHLTLAYLGDDVADWDDEIVAAVYEVARTLTDPTVEDPGQPVPADHDGRGPGQRGPLTLHIFSHSHFNPNGGPNNEEPCMVYQFKGEGDLNAVESLHSDACWQIKEAIGEVNFPEQYERYVPHITAGYNLPPDTLSYTGPVTFDRLRVVLADTVTDYPLGGGMMDEVTAAVARTKGGSVSSEAREKARQAGHAMKDGSFPIEDAADLDNAIQSVGRAKDPEAARRHIIKQAKRLGLESKIPDSWNADGSVTASAALDDTVGIMTADRVIHDLESLAAAGPKGYKHGWIRVGPGTEGSAPHGGSSSRSESPSGMAEKISKAGLNLGPANPDGSRPIQVTSGERRRRTGATGTSIRSPSTNTVATLGSDGKVYVGYNSNDRREVPPGKLDKFLDRAKDEGPSGPGWKPREVLQEIAGERKESAETNSGGNVDISLAQPKIMSDLIRYGDPPGAELTRKDGKDVVRVTDAKAFTEWLDGQANVKLPRGAPTTAKSKKRAAEDLGRSVRNELGLTASVEGDSDVDELDDGQREALTAAVGALVDKLGPVGAHGLAPQVFQSPESLAFADTLIELPPADGEHLTAAAGMELPPISVFDKPENLPPGTGHHVDHEPLPCGLRRVYGRLGEWNVPHIGINGQKVYIPRSPSGYRWFHTKSAWAQGPNGPEEIEVGHLTFGTGHAPTGPGVDYMAAAAHYDHSGNRGATIRVYDDDPIGPVYAGVTVAGLEGARLQEFTESDISGDWRRPMGLPLDLIATLCVNVGGFPKIGLSLAASGEPLALVASAKAWGNPAAVVDVEAIAAAVVSQMERRTTLTRQREALLAALDDSSERMAALLDELDDDLGADEIEFIDSTPDPTGSEIDDASSVLTAAVGRRGTNWVEQTGTGHLPRYISRIKKHLMRKGMTESRAIAVAVNVVKRMCATGDLNFPGAQQVNAKSRAEACSAVAEWEAKKAQAKAT